ncbi:unnamed protein product [Ciceribacter sp. T2.26MG-112.2]|nr:unnamed protein product [Ciceribacter naphthalenivorans]
MASEWQRCHSLFQVTCFVNRLFATCRFPQFGADSRNRSAYGPTPLTLGQNRYCFRLNGQDNMAALS